MPYVRAHKIDDFNEIICLLTSNLSNFYSMVTASQNSVINQIFGSVEGPSTKVFTNIIIPSLRIINLVHNMYLVFPCDPFRAKGRFEILHSQTRN